ncbi:F-box domain containing protein [Parasponia andersonii]|uniref:F-box domain containing protein n=1 Tax=Parasponia andersonii TaxID=3476 RepID=A0A2P5AHS0_PARAD|nr:F-box domain containing protein [Parasponia andersonii]
MERTKKKWLDLEEEVVVEIMSFLPPKSLIQFKLVNKLWCAFMESLINDPLFVVKHLYNMKNNLLLYSTSLAFICKVPCSCDEPELITTLANSTNELVHSPSCPQYVRPHLLTLFHGHDHDDDDQIRHVVEDFDLPLICGDTKLNGITEYNCNGLVCLTREVSDYPDYVLCNPSTKKWRLLPDLINRFSFARLGGGLGCDSRDKDYKFVRFGYHLDSKDSIAEIYSLGTDSWREIKFDWSEMKFGFKVTDVMAAEVDKEILCRGVLYWVVQGHKIMCFDVSDEVFRSLPLPDNLQSSKKLSSFPKQIKLAVWNEAVALFHYPNENGVVRSIEIWVMMDDCIGGVESSCSWFK